MNATALPAPSAVLNKSEAAEFLRIKPRTLDGWIRKKHIPFSRLPSGTIRFRRDHLMGFIKKFEVAA